MKAAYLHANAIRFSYHSNEIILLCADAKVIHQLFLRLMPQGIEFDPKLVEEVNVDIYPSAPGYLNEKDVGFKGALHRIAAIKLNPNGGDYDEINEAKAIALEALGLPPRP